MTPHQLDQIERDAEAYLKQRMPHLFINGELLNPDKLPVNAQEILSHYKQGRIDQAEAMKERIKELEQACRYAYNDFVNHVNPMCTQMKMHEFTLTTKDLAKVLNITPTTDKI